MRDDIHANRQGFIEKNGAGIATTTYTPIVKVFIEKNGAGGPLWPAGANLFNKKFNKTQSSPVPPPPSAGLPVSSCAAPAPPNSPSYKVPSHK